MSGAMATLALFRDDAYLRECEARVTAVHEAGIELDRTVFYPLGGGQAGDTGCLVRADGTRVRIVDARKSKAPEATPDDVVHVPEPGSALPAIGEVAPLRTLVTVRAMVPVAGMPPKKGLTKFATPWAISSWLGSWRSPVSPSATRAHSSDSIAPSKAKVSVGMVKALALAQLNSGHTRPGNSA